MKGNFYHIVNRGVEQREIFLDEDDYLRFVHNLYDFNDKNNVLPFYDRKSSLEVAPPRKKRYREELVDVFCWTLMPTHPHILVQEKIDGGASKFSQKNFGGYTMYFNTMNQRKGVLFQGRSKIILVKRDAHFFWLPFYILANPLDLFEPDWRNTKIKNPKKAFEFLINYKWSSLGILLGGATSKLMERTVNKRVFYEIYDTNEKKFKKDFIEWLGGYDGNFEDFSE